MPFIGNQPALSYTSFAKQDFTTSATTSYTLDHPVTNANELALFINFVRQEPTTAYTASGTTLTLTSATSASDDMYCVFLGKAVQTVNPPSGSVGTSQIADLAVTSGKLASGVLPTNTPAFLARLTSHQTVSDDTFTKIQFNTEIYDTANAYDNSTNYRFTVPSGQAGKYFYYSSLTLDSDVSSNLDGANINPRVNGASAIGGREFIFYNNPIRLAPVIALAVLDLSVGDYLEVFARIEANDATGGRVTGDFGAYKIIE